ncbi:MarR family transcriptional regulator for hemolysin [Desulfobaculum xiamenense]|uniref:MarR family transcriptional regulator for hemolysin n=1 Tax=Desulfobaculum xiamenense TaxID=995050 RepID=A0A846QNT1_9BACT|nr:MarR family transcriptional regulator [Desulfobaculum xiamenense]NJB68122.1 MarR family transcriptional regulator for hemolysin [Desulfobaculum xiamenense]
MDPKLSEIFNGKQRELGLLIAEIAREWRLRLDERMKPFGMSGARWVALLCLQKIGPTSQKHLAETIGVESPTLVRLLDRLEQDGWVLREVSETDRRKKLVRLTAQAGSFLDDFERIAISLREEIIKGIPKDELETCTKVLVDIRASLFRLAQ